MSEEKPSDPISAIIKPITDITVSVGVVMAYIQGIFKIAETPIPNTFSLLLIAATSIIVIGRRWGKLNEKKKKTQSNGNSKTAAKGNLFERLSEPFKEAKRDPYVMPLPRRRLEAGFLAALTVFTLGWSGFNAKGVMAELTTNPALTCSYAQGKDNLLVIVADVSEIGSGPKVSIADDVFDALIAVQSEGHYDVCRLKEIIPESVSAAKKAAEHAADLLIWGRGDDIGLKINLEAPALGNPHRSLGQFTSVEVASSEFSVDAPEHIAYAIQFAFSEIYMLQGEITQAQTNQIKLIREAEQDGLRESNPLALARGYFLMGLLYDPNYSSDSDDEKALDGYWKAFELDPTLYAARHNRGLVLAYSGNVDDAMAEFTFVVENDVELKASALANRASLQADPEARLRDLDELIKLDPDNGYFLRGLERFQQEDFRGASEDFEKAVEADPEDYSNFHLLGQMQLYAGELEAAKLTYERIIPTLNDDTREQVIQDLRESAAARPEIAPAVEEIISALQKATLH